jgi:cytochrome oxidase assembly protein ShyY1
MDPRSEKRLDFEINNFSALPGADYPVFCYFQYDQASIHHTAVRMAVIKIIEQQNFFRRYRWLWMAIAALLIIALFILTIKNRDKNQGHSRINKP